MRNNVFFRLCSLLLCLSFVLLFASCGASGPKEKEKETDPTTQTSDADETTRREETEKTPDETTAAAPSSELHTDVNGVVIAPTGRPADVSEALSAYKKAAAKVKDDCPGFTRIQWQDFNEIDTGEPTGIAARILSVVSKNLVTHRSEADAKANPRTVAKGDADGAEEFFPIFGSAYGYVDAPDTEFITGAELTEGKGYTEYYLYFAKEVNPVAGGIGMGSLMCPFNRTAILDAIKNYVWNVQKDTLKLDCTYDNCYLMFRIDKRGRMTRLENHMYTDIEAEAQVDLLVAETDFLNGTCRYEEHYIFSDFEY